MGTGTWIHSAFGHVFSQFNSLYSIKISAQIYTNKCITTYFCIHHTITSFTRQYLKIKRYQVLLSEEANISHLGFKSKIELNIQILTTRLLRRNWSEQVEEIGILKCGSICLLAANVRTKIIPNVIKHFIFARHTEPTSLVIAQAALLLGSLGLLLARELNNRQDSI